MTIAAAPFHAHQRVSASHQKHGVHMQQTSSRKFSAKHDVLSYRQHFARLWQVFITEHFDSPAHAAHVFQVDPTTAENWFLGRNAPQGWVIGRALKDPELRGSVVDLLTGDV